MRASVTVGRIGGIPIAVHYTWLIAFALITWSLAAGFFPRFFPGWETATYWWLASIAAVSLFLSVLVHELAHSTVALKRGIPVDSITLFIFGGVSNLRADASKAADEFLIALVGPLTSVGLGGLAWLMLQAVPHDLEVLRALISYVALTNAVLGAFNLLPGFPLDGGRVLRSVVWATTRDFARATTWAAMAGQAMSFGFIAFGVLQMLDGRVISGLWIALIGWFLNMAADSGRREVQAHELLGDVAVSTLMNPAMATVPADSSVEALVRDVLVRSGQRSATVIDHGQLVGIVTLTDVQRAPEGVWADASVAAIMTRTPLHTIALSGRASDALRLLAERDINQLVVMDGDRLVGVLSRSDIVNHLDLRRELASRKDLRP